MMRIFVLTMMLTFNFSADVAQVQVSHIRWFKIAGKVLDKNGHPVHQGRVCLKDAHAHILRIKSIGHNGQFDLMWLDARLDYEIYAEQGNSISKSVLVPAYPETEKVVIELRLEPN